VKKPGALRPQTSYLLAFLALAGSGALAGAALADGLPPVLPTSVGPTTPVATATLSLPTVSTPAVTTPTATTPTATAPTATVPSVTTPVVTTPAATTPALTTPAVTTPAVTTPAVTPPVSASPAPVVHAAVHAVTTASTPVVRAAATRKAAVPLPRVTTPPAVALPPRTAAQAVIADGVRSSGSTVPAGVTGAGSVPPPQPGLSASLLRARAPIATAPIANALIANAIEGARAVTAVTVLRSALVAPLVAGAAGSPDRSTPSPQLQRSPSSGSAGWSSVARDPVEVAGGLALLVALLGLGAAGAARSSTGIVATCAELGRFPFPRFRVLPCDRFAGGGATDTVSVVAGGSAASADVVAAGRRVVPRVAQVLGAQAHSATAPALRAWELLKTVVLTILVAANGLLLAIRWQLGRWQSR
jgi:hypothetical protein